jgi:four helix bundle protein
MNPIPSFKDLGVWQRAMDLVVQIYEVTRGYPLEEKFGLTAETRKTSRSVCANIAEGKSRTGGREFRKFVSIALGSAGELHTQVLMADRLGYLQPAAFQELESRIEELSRMLRGLERSLAERLSPLA